MQKKANKKAKELQTTIEFIIKNSNVAISIPQIAQDVKIWLGITYPEFLIRTIVYNLYVSDNNYQLTEPNFVYYSI